MERAAAPRSYWSDTRAPRYSLLFAAPLLLLYEALAFALSGQAAGGIRNGADYLLKSVFIMLGGHTGLALFGVVLAGTAGWLIWRDWRTTRDLRPKRFLAMLAESVLYALLFGGVASRLTAALLQPLAIGAAAVQEIGQGAFGLPTQLMVSLGAGLYEELLFRVLLVGALFAWLSKRARWPVWLAGTLATLVGAVVFSAFHYVGPFGDPWALGSFTFRAVAGVLFSGLYLARGFGIAAWTHALYDVFLTLVLAGR